MRERRSWRAAGRRQDVAVQHRCAYLERGAHDGARGRRADCTALLARGLRRLVLRFRGGHGESVSWAQQGHVPLPHNRGRAPRAPRCAEQTLSSRARVAAQTRAREASRMGSCGGCSASSGGSRVAPSCAACGTARSRPAWRASSCCCTGASPWRSGTGTPGLQACGPRQVARARAAATHLRYCCCGATVRRRRARARLAVRARELHAVARVHAQAAEAAHLGPARAHACEARMRLVQQASLPPRAQQQLSAAVHRRQRRRGRPGAREARVRGTASTRHGRRCVDSARPPPARRGAGGEPYCMHSRKCVRQGDTGDVLEHHGCRHVCARPSSPPAPPLVALAEARRARRERANTVALPKASPRTRAPTGQTAPTHAGRQQTRHRRSGGDTEPLYIGRKRAGALRAPPTRGPDPSRGSRHPAHLGAAARSERPFSPAAQRRAQCSRSCGPAPSARAAGRWRSSSSARVLLAPAGARARRRRPAERPRAFDPCNFGYGGRYGE